MTSSFQNAHRRADASARATAASPHVLLPPKTRLLLRVLLSAWSITLLCLPIGLAQPPGLLADVGTLPFLPALPLAARPPLLAGFGIGALLANARRGNPKLMMRAHRICFAAFLLGSIFLLLGAPNLSEGTPSAARSWILTAMAAASSIVYLALPVTLELLAELPTGRGTLPAVLVLCLLFYQALPPHLFACGLLFLLLAPTCLDALSKGDGGARARPVASSLQSSSADCALDIAALSLSLALLVCASQSTGLLSISTESGGLSWNPSAPGIAPGAIALMVVAPTVQRLWDVLDHKALVLLAAAGLLIESIDNPGTMHIVIFCCTALTLAHGAFIGPSSRTRARNVVLACLLSAGAASLYANAIPYDALWSLLPLGIVFLAYCVNISQHALAPHLASSEIGRSGCQDSIPSPHQSTIDESALAKYNLTAREREVFAQHLEGASFAEIAAGLGISKSTACTYHSRAVEKIGPSEVARLFPPKQETTEPPHTARHGSQSHTSIPLAPRIIVEVGTLASTILIVLIVLPAAIAPLGIESTVPFASLAVICLGIIGPRIAAEPPSRFRLPSRRASMIALSASVALFAATLTIRFPVFPITLVRVGSCAGMLLSTALIALDMQRLSAAPNRNPLVSAVELFCISVGAAAWSLGNLPIRKLNYIALALIPPILACAHLAPKTESSGADVSVAASTPGIRTMLALVGSAFLCCCSVNTDMPITVMTFFILPPFITTSMRAISRNLSGYKAFDPASAHAAVALALFLGLFLGATVVRTNPCMTTIHHPAAALIQIPSIVLAVFALKWAHQSIDLRCGIIEGKGSSLEDALLSCGLTRMEASVIVQYSTGRTAQSIAKELYIEPSTVRTHIKHSYAKLNVHNRAELERRIQEILQSIVLEL